MRITILILVISAMFCKYATGQDFTFDNVSNGELDMKKYAKDTSAHAVVLQEFGKASIETVIDENIRLVFDYHVKIKIIDNKGVDNATVEIPVYNYSDEDVDSYEIVEGIAGVTYYKDDNGLTQKIELGNKNIYPVKQTKHLAIYKFAMPGVRSGSVIEYKYRLVSPYLEKFRPWVFQGSIPKVYSEYETHIPGYWSYYVSLKGGLVLTKKTSTTEAHCFSVNGGSSSIVSTSADCAVTAYGMGDIPAFVGEEYMTARDNFLSSINFELAEYKGPYSDVKMKVTKEWKDADEVLKQEFFFGNQLKKKMLFSDRIIPVVAGIPDGLGKAKAVYAWVQQMFKWNGDSYFESSDALSKALEKHTGNAADINLSLIIALNAAGLNANAVLLSTRDNGTVSSLYPAISDFNYVIARVDIGGTGYLLDATDPLLAFGMLPLRCLNGKGRLFSMDKPSYFIDINPPQKQKSTRTMDLTLQTDGKLKGTLVTYAVGYDAYQERIAVKKFNSTDEYLEDFNNKLHRVKILKANISNLDSLEQPVIERYELEIDITNKMAENSLSFNPFFWNRIDVNPFNLTERLFPVDMGMPIDQRATFLFICR